MNSPFFAPFPVLCLGLLVSVVASPGTQQGSWTSYLNALPDSKLPSSPILGNGRLGVILDSSSHQRNSTGTGPGQMNTLDLYMNTNSFWSCTSCDPPAIDPDHVDTSCCTVVTLGGVSVRLTPTFSSPLPSFSASQFLLNASLTATFPTPGGGAVHTTTVVHPSDTLTVTNVSSTSPSSPTTLDIATWVHKASGAGGGPSPWRVGCASATTGVEGPCTPASLTFASRNASTRNALVMPVAGALASGLQLGPGASVLSVAVDVGGSECVHTVTLPPGSWVAVVTGVGITRGPGLGDPVPLAVGRVVGALSGSGGGAGAVAAASLAHWEGVWGVSGVTLPTRPLAQALFYGAVYVLEGAAPTSSSPDEVAPGLYGPWASQDNPAWQGDFTLDYNYNAPFYGSFASGHGDQVEGYWAALSAWIPSGQKKAQAQALLAHISCPPTALYYNCHLAPWGQASLDPMSKFMTWNLPHALLPVINHFEYTQNLSFAASTIYPLLSGVMDWYACYLAYNSSSGLWVDYNAFNEDMEHEEQPAVNPTIALALIQRVATATVEMAVALGLSPPPAYTSIATHLTPPSTLNQSVVVPGGGGGGVWVPLNNTRCSDVTASWTFYDIPTVAACEASCDGTGGCSLFSYCPPVAANNASGCTGRDGQPAPNTCWGMPINQLPHCTNTSVSPGNTGWVSGYREGGGGKSVNVTAWGTFQGGGVGSMDSFAFYPNWPSESLHPSSPYTPPSTQAIARATAALVGGDFVGGRGVDVLTGAVRAGRAPPHNATSPYDGFTPAQVLQGMEAYLGRWFGGNQLAYAPGGGIENTGMIRAVTEMLLQSYPNAAAGGGGGGAATPPPLCLLPGGCGYTQALFPFWPRNESASFWGLGGKGGVIVDAAFDGGMGATMSPFNATAKFTRGGGAASTLYFLDPWGVGPSGRVAVDCAGVTPPVSWNGEGTVFSFLAPLGVVCKVGIV